MATRKAGRTNLVTCARRAPRRDSPKGHSAWNHTATAPEASSTFLRPLAPPALLGFPATMDALTPLPPGLGGRRPIGPSSAAQVSLLNVQNRPTVPSPTTPCRLRSLACFRSRAYRTCHGQSRQHIPAPVGRIVTWASPLASRLATTRGRIEFVILRPSRSPPVASHPVSRRRSYLRL
jgi:hypothetical protein